MLTKIANVPHDSQNPTTESFLAQTLDQLKVSILATLLLAVIVCGIYPAVVWALAQAMFPAKANGSLIGKDGLPAGSDDAVGSVLIGQNSSDARYFHPRPSAAGSGYDPTASGGSNLGPTSAKLFNGSIKKDDKGNEVVDFDGIRDRMVHYCMENEIAYDSSPSLDRFKDASGNLDDVKLIKALNENDRALVFRPKVEIPADAVTASGSGLDPDISVNNAMLQLPRVARARGLDEAALRLLVDRATEGPQLGILGERRVNVLRLNLSLHQPSK